MSTTITIRPTSPATVALMIAGPAISALAAHRLAGMSAALVTLLLWMPALPYSIPAMAMANRRDLERHRHPELRAWLKRLYVNGETNLVVAHWANIAGVAAAAAVLTRL